MRPVARFSVRHIAMRLQYGLAGAQVISRNDHLEVRAKIFFHHLHAFRSARLRAFQCAASQSASNMCLSVIGSSRGTSILNSALNFFAICRLFGAPGGTLFGALCRNPLAK